MSNEPSDFWPATVLSASAGEETDKNNQPTGRIRVRVGIRFEDGPSKGKTDYYEDEINAKSSIYVARTLKAIGWKGAGLRTIDADVAAWIAATGGKTTAEVRHIEIKKGKKYEEWQDAVYKWGADGKKGPEPERPIWHKVNSLGRGPRPLAAPAANSLADADAFMRQAIVDDGGAPPPDDAPPSDDIPFATCARVGLGEIARVLR